MKKHIVWLCVSVAALFVGLRFAKKEIQIVEKPVEVIKEVDRIVEKRVEVPAEIPDSYKLAKQFSDSYFQASWFEKNGILKGVPSVRVVISVDDELKGKITESELRDSIELSLRKNGVPVKDDSGFWLGFSVVGVWNQDNTTYSYTTSISLDEAIPVLRSGEFKKTGLTIWQDNYVGYAGSQRISEGIGTAADKLVTSFSNAYLSANSK